MRIRFRSSLRPVTEGPHPVRRAGWAVVPLLLLLMGTPAGSATAVSDTLSVVKDDVRGVDNSRITVLVSAATPFTGDTVMISRDDEFADALASGLLQRNGPMFTVPTNGPIPPEVRQRIAELGPARAVVLGGEAAVSAAVATELAELTGSVERLAGGSRFDTAIAIAAAEAPQADTVMLARAFPSPGSSDDTQAFADTLAAGGVAARNGWPILLTQTEQLTGPTADYLAGGTVQRVLVLGGTAAISEQALDEVREMVPDVQRIAGDTRFETAVALEKAVGAQDASETTQVILVEGTATPAFNQSGVLAPDAWAGGFASANRAAVFDAPILLTASGDLPAPTAAFLATGVNGDPDVAPLLTCVMPGPACETARRTAGLPPAVTVTASPDSGQVVGPGTAITISFDGHEGDAVISGSCLAGSTEVTAGQRTTVVVADDVADQVAGADCEVVVDGIVLADGRTQTDTFTYPVQPPPPATFNNICGLAVDPVAEVRYVVTCLSDSEIHRTDLAGAPLTPPTVPYPDGPSNDIDIDVIDGPTRIFGVQVPAGSLLLVNGEVEAGAWVLDPTTGEVLAGPVDLEEAGTTVGVAWDRRAEEIVELSWDNDTVSRLDPATGALRDSFQTMPDPDDPDVPGSLYDVFYGDIEVSGCTGHLFVVSSNEEEILELTPDGGLIRLVPSGTTGVASIALDDRTGAVLLGRNNSSQIVVRTDLDLQTC